MILQKCQNDQYHTKRILEAPNRSLKMGSFAHFVLLHWNQRGSFTSLKSFEKCLYIIIAFFVLNMLLLVCWNGLTFRGSIIYQLLPIESGIMVNHGLWKQVYNIVVNTEGTQSGRWGWRKWEVDNNGSLLQWRGLSCHR